MGENTHSASDSVDHAASDSVGHAGTDSADRSAPGGIDHAALDRIETASRVLDDLIRVPGTDIRFGLDPILGILPVAGDSVATVLSGYIIFEGYRAGAPASLLAKMIALVAVDSVVGSVPVLGTLFDVFWKANSWNVAMLTDHLEAEEGRTEYRG